MNMHSLEEFISAYQCDSCKKQLEIDPEKSKDKQFWYHKKGENIDYCQPCFVKLNILSSDEYATVDLYQTYEIVCNAFKESACNCTPPKTVEIPLFIKKKIEQSGYFVKMLGKHMTKTSILFDSVVSINSGTDWEENTSNFDSFDSKKFGSLKNWVPFEGNYSTFFCYNVAKDEPLFGAIASGVLDESGEIGLNLVYKNHKEMEKDRKLYEKEVSCELITFAEWCRRKYWLSNCFSSQK